MGLVNLDGVDEYDHELVAPPAKQTGAKRPGANGEGEADKDLVVKKKKRALGISGLRREDLFHETKGLKAIKRSFEAFKTRGKGHELADLNRLLRKYQLWAVQMAPHLTLAETIEGMDRSTSQLKKTDVQVYMHDLRDEECRRLFELSLPAQSKGDRPAPQDDAVSVASSDSGGSAAAAETAPPAKKRAQRSATPQSASESDSDGAESSSSRKRPAGAEQALARPSAAAETTTAGPRDAPTDNGDATKGEEKRRPKIAAARAVVDSDSDSDNEETQSLGSTSKAAGGTQSADANQRSQTDDARKRPQRVVDSSDEEEL